MRRCADVLIAVLTQQKYNDAAVKEFFRKAGDEDKAVLVVFNQCVLPEDEPFWPMWLETFCRATAITPEAVYLAPSDRRAAEGLRLPFFERPMLAASVLNRLPVKRRSADPVLAAPAMVQALTIHTAGSRSISRSCDFARFE